MAYDLPSIQLQAAYNSHAAQQALSESFSLTVSQKDATAWRQCRRFCRCLNIAPDIQGIKEPIPLFHILSKFVRDVLLSAKGNLIKKLSIDQYIQSIVKIVASVRANNSRHNPTVKIDLCLGQQLASYQKEDSPPDQLWPLPITVIQVLDTAS